jgi:hypothetical protein
MINLSILASVKKISLIILFAHIIALSIGLSAWADVGTTSVKEKGDVSDTMERSDIKNKKNTPIPEYSTTDI